MSWVLGISVAFNIILLVVFIFMVYGIARLQEQVENAIEEWRKWETRWWNISHKICDELGYHVRVDVYRQEVNLERIDKDV